MAEIWECKVKWDEKHEQADNHKGFKQKLGKIKWK